MSDYILQIKVRNGPMLRAMRTAGFKNAQRLAIAAKVAPSEVGGYLSLSIPAYRDDGLPRAGLMRISEALGRPIEDLFPPQHLIRPLEISRSEIEVSMDDIEAICGARSLQSLTDLESSVDDNRRVRRLMDLLSPRQRSIITRRFGLNGEPALTLDEVAIENKISRARASQIELKALRVMAEGSKKVGISGTGWKEAQG